MFDGPGFHKTNDRLLVKQRLSYSSDFRLNVFRWDTAHHGDSDRPCAVPKPTPRQQKRGCRGNKLSNPRQLFTRMGGVKERQKNEREENIQSGIIHYEKIPSNLLCERQLKNLAYPTPL
jgi:hypothetical protein